MAVSATEIENEFQAGLRLIHEGQPSKAENKLLSILKYVPDNPVLLERIGYCYALQSDWKNSEEFYAKALTLLPENTEILNNYGCILQKQNRWEDALPFFEKSLKAEPDNFSALSNLAQCLNYCKQYDEAIVLYAKAIEKSPNNSSLRIQLAQILHDQSRFDEEVAQYRLLLAMTGENTKAQIKMALALFANGEREEAGDLIKSINKSVSGLPITLFEWANTAQEQEKFSEATYGLGLLVEIAPDNTDFWRAYIINHYFSFGLERSLPVFEKAITLHPKEPSFYRALAIAYGQAGQLEKSKNAAKSALEITPNDPKAHQTYAATLRQHQKVTPQPDGIDEVCKHFDKAIELAQGSENTLQAIGQSLVETKEAAIMKSCLENLPETLKDSYTSHLLQNFICISEGNYKAAIKHGEKCRNLAPKNSFALSELAESYFYMENYEAALRTSREAVEVSPKDSQALMRLGYIAIDCGEIEEGLMRAQQAYEQNPHDPAVQLSLGLMNLLIENWDLGWEMYDARFRMLYKNRMDIPPLPRWDGQSFENLELVLICEQGLGDIIQFSRFIPMIAKRVGKVIFVANNNLLHMFEQYSDQVEVVSTASSINVNAENGRWTTLLELPRLLNIEKENWGEAVPYIQAEPDRIQKWAKRIDTQDGTLKVGIAWQGSPGARIDVGRSIPLEKFAPLSSIDHVQLVSLQKYSGEEQIENVSFKDKIFKPGDDFDNGSKAFADTAALMMSLDLIITSDTSIAHLAGALGRPVWLALKHVPDWRWHLNTDKNAWYPTMKLFRQKTPGVWEDVFQEIEGELTRLKKPVNQH
ncbi:MAG: tetratricopeptide repeat protein [Methyloligellaceae bacterium]